MTVLVTGFTGNSGYEVAQTLKSKGIPFKCAVRNVEKAVKRYGGAYDFVRLDFAEIAGLTFRDPQLHENKAYTITGEEALDFSQVAEKMSAILGQSISYTNPSAKDFKQYMLSRGKDKGFINVVIGIHFPTKLGLAKGVTSDFQKLTGRKPNNIETYIHDYRHFWE